MADERLLALLLKSVDAWNQWRKGHPSDSPDLVGAVLKGAHLFHADLSGANLSKAILVQANLLQANLSGANLADANLAAAYLCEADLSSAVLTGARLSEANLTRAVLSGANLSGANLISGNLVEANLSSADLSGANLSGAALIRTNLSRAVLRGARIYGVSVWGVRLDGAHQTSLVITPIGEPEIVVDNLEVAQFIYLMLNNENLRAVIDTVTSKLVLILGRFTAERKAVLDALRDTLRTHDLVPVLFDFVKPASKDVTGTVETLARMARFIVADLTDPSSIPHELATVVPFLRTTPVVLLRLAGSTGYSMVKDLEAYERWVLPVRDYPDPAALIGGIQDYVIQPAEAKLKILRPADRPAAGREESA